MIVFLFVLLSIFIIIKILLYKRNVIVVTIFQKKNSYITYIKYKDKNNEQIVIKEEGLELENLWQKTQENVNALVNMDF